MASTLVQSIAQVSEAHPERRARCASSTSALFSIDWIDQQPRIPFCRDEDIEQHYTADTYQQHPSSLSSSSLSLHLQPSSPPTAPIGSRNDDHPAWHASGRSSPSSPSEFEFSMSTLGSPASAAAHMLPADQLFHDGKLLPLYNATSIAPPSSIRSAAKESIHVDYSTVAAPAMDDNCGLKQPSPAFTAGTGAGAGNSCPQQHRVDNRPLSPKAPTCTSRWKDLLRLRKVQNQDGKDGPDHCNKGQARVAQHLSWHAAEQIVAGRRSTDAGNGNEPPKSRTSEIESQRHGHPVPCCPPQEPGAFTVDHVLCPSTIQRGQQSEMAMPSSRSSEDLMERSGLNPGMDTECVNGDDGVGLGATRQRRSTAGNRARSPSKQQIEQWSNGRTLASTSPKRGGSRGVSPGRPSVGSRPTESSRSAIAPRLVVRGLDRSYSSPRPMRRRPEQLRSVIGRQRVGEGSSSSSSTALERSISYSAGVRVSPVINVPMYITPSFRKGSKIGIFNFFSSKKEKPPSSANNRKPVTLPPV